MDSESYVCNEEDKQTATSDSISNYRDVLKSPRIRRDSVDFDRINRFLIKCEFGIILPCSLIFWIIFLLLR
jgi:hypothetical protein